MAFKTEPETDVDFAAENALRQQAKREAAAAEERTVTLRRLELRFHLLGGWMLHGVDAKTGTSVTVDSTLWPDAERDAFVALPAIRIALVDSEATLSLKLRGQSKGRDFIAQFVKAAV